MQLLEKPASVVLGPVSDLNVREFFSHFKISRSKDFASLVLDRVYRPISLPSTTLTRRDVIKDSIDSELRPELEPKHIFTIEEFLGYSLALIAQQAKGQNGSLITTGYANIFYVVVDKDVLSVGLDWSNTRGFWKKSNWFFGISGLDDREGWQAGCAVFSRNW
jgi:hypothetical protein